MTVKRISFYIARFFLPVLLAASLFFTGKLNTVRNSPDNGASHPGYYEQWLREKRPSNGEFPHWARQQWALWDRTRVRNRTAENIIDAVYELGPRDIGGRTRSVWIDPRNENIILAAAISGGMWRSEDGGATWKQLNDQEVSLMASCITSSPFNPDIIYYGTGEGRANSADVDGNGIFKSTDGGKTFKQIASTIGLPGFETIWDIRHSLDDETTLFVGTQTNGLWRSTDAGASWEQVFNGGNRQVNNILVLPGNRVLISLQSNRVYASDSAGKTNTFIPVDFPAFPAPGQYRRIQMASCEKYPQVCYAIVEGFDFRDTPVAFYKSRDYGRNWEKMPRPSGVGASYQGYCLMLGVHPEDSTRIVAAGVTISQTNDGGRTWQRKVTGHADHHGFAAYPFSKGDFIAGTDGGLYRYSWNDTAVKQNLNNGYNVTQFYAGNFGPKGAISISGAQDNGTQVATGVLKTLKFWGADGAYAHIGQQDGKVAYFSTQDTGIRRISNFDPYTVPPRSQVKKILDQRFRSDGVDFINAYGMNTADQNQLYYRTNRYIYRSLNGGDNWTPITNIHGGMKAIGISAEIDPVVYVGGSGAQLYRINNAATTAQGKEIVYNNAVPVEVTNDFLNAIAVNPKNRNTIYLAFSNYSTQPRIWRADGMDGTPVFTNISGDLPPGLPVNYVATDPEFPDKNLFAGTDFGLYYSTDSGNTWIKEKQIPNVAVHEIKMRKDRILFLYTHGRGMWAVQLSGADPLTYTGPEFNLFPNPADDYIKISLKKFTENAEYKVYNTAGRLVAEGKFSDYEYILNTGRFSNGHYYLKLQTATSTHVAGFIVR